MEKLKAELKRLVFGVINLIQKYLLIDDFISIKIRITLLKCMGLKIGKSVKIMSGCDFLGNNIIIENHVFINRQCYFDNTAHIKIENNVSVGHGVTFITANHKISHPSKRCGAVKKDSIVIGRGCWIGAKSTLISAKIGEGAIVAACSLVKGSIPKNVIVKGLKSEFKNIIEHHINDLNKIA